MALALCSAVAFPPLTAQEKDDSKTTEPSPLEPSEIFYETATVQARPIDDAVLSVTVLGSEEIDPLGAREVSEVLDFVPGISISRGARGGLSVAEARGGDPNFTLILLDGVPLNDPTDSLGGAFNLASFGIAGLDRLEVVRGPASSIYGSTALAGVVQLFTQGGSRAAPSSSNRSPD